ncbi:MAG: hypothetical protein ACRD2Q_05305 [Terriglobales bacterium]
MKERGMWNGSFNGKESSLQQLAPYIGKLKSGIVSSLISHFTNEGDWICDPFSGCGVVPLEALLLSRKARANDLSRYAICVTRGKLSAPPNLDEALARTQRLIRYAERHWTDHDLRQVPRWVRSFFHPRTLKEALAGFDFCQRYGESFLAACLCGILHHQRPGFLSYPASHMVPYLRTSLFPRGKFPELYEYRALGQRLVKKVMRVYRRANVEKQWSRSDYHVTRGDASDLSWPDESVDFVLTSPPYYRALDYARDNRLRLWFLGETDWHKLNKRLTSGNSVYELHMKKCLREMHRVLKPKKHCVLIVGDVQRDGKTRDTGAVLGALASEVTQGGLALDCVVEDEIPDIRRSRRRTKATRMEKILVLTKLG